MNSPRKQTIDKATALYKVLGDQMFNLVQAEQAGCTVEDLQHFNLFNMLKFKSGTNFTMKKYIYYRFLKDPALLNYEITKPEFETEEQLVYNPNRVKMSPDERQLFKHIKQFRQFNNFKKI